VRRTGTAVDEVDEITGAASLGDYRANRTSPAAAPVRTPPTTPAAVAGAESPRAGEPAAQTARQRLRERAAQRAGGQRSGPALMDLASQSYHHIRRDLVKIGLLALAMFALIVVLALVIR
jgi:hypothetical protein